MAARLFVTSEWRDAMSKMTGWQTLALLLDELSGGLWGLLMRLCGVDVDGLRAQAAQEEADRIAAEAARLAAERERQEDVAMSEQTLAALLDLRADVQAWSPPEPGHVDPAIATERRARHAAIKTASEVVVRSGYPGGLEVDAGAAWKPA